MSKWSVSRADNLVLLKFGFSAFSGPRFFRRLVLNTWNRARLVLLKSNEHYKGCPLKNGKMLSACEEFVCKVMIQCKEFWKLWYKYLKKKLIPESLRVSNRLFYECRSLVGSDMLGRALSPCREGTSSFWAWAGAQFGLPSIPCKPTLSGFPQNPPLDGVQ